MLLRATTLFCVFSAILDAQPTNLSIQWVGQSCFVLTSPGGTTVVTDPPVSSLGYTLPSVNADAVTITHNHTDHNNAAGVGGKFTLVDGRPITARQEMTAGGLPFVLIPGFHDNTNGSTRGPNTIMRWAVSKRAIIPGKERASKPSTTKAQDQTNARIRLVVTPAAETRMSPRR